ncbi:MAG: class II aldolase/adducin family protein [Gammaproteobacteria bacterium]|nr:MAG: class II aldolase/adducin family protein [Gammaproteobacteria bacterium]
MDPRAQLVQYYRWLRQYGLNDSHSGNASIRDDDTIWVTPTGACADILQSEQLIACSADGSIGKGASLDAGLHVAVYQKNPKVKAVLHSHGAYSVAMTLDGNDFIPQDFEGQYYFKRIPVISLPYDQYLAQAAEAVSDVLKDHAITIVRGHGVYAAAESLNLAYKWTCSLELSAKTCFLARQAGTLK